MKPIELAIILKTLTLLNLDTRSIKMKDQFEMIAEIKKGIGEVTEKTKNLTDSNYDKLSVELRQIHDSISSLGELVWRYCKNTKESEAKKKISLMLEKGYSFSRIEIDNMVFSITDTGEINRCYGRYEEPDDYPIGFGPSRTWPH
jgi:hypothetical protein